MALYMKFIYVQKANLNVREPNSDLNCLWKNMGQKSIGSDQN